jgi:hypothetical protein
MKTTAHRSDTGGVAAANAAAANAAAANAAAANAAAAAVAAAQWAAFTVPIDIALHHVLLLNDCIIQNKIREW